MLFCKFRPCNAGQQSVKRKCRSNAYKCEKNPAEIENNNKRAWKRGWGGVTYIDELNLPDLLDQLHGGVAVDEEGLGVVAELQRLQPLGHRRGVVAVVADRPHLRGGRETERSTSLVPFFYLEAFYYLFFFFTRQY